MPHNFNQIQDILTHYHLDYQLTEFIDFNQVPAVNVPEWFKQELRFAITNRGELDREAFACEFIIVPFLREAWKRHSRLSLFSHIPIKAEELTIVPDYLVTAKHPTGYKTVYKPLLITVEAKNEQFEEGWMQALLQAVVCQKLNGTADIPILTVVTTGDFWQFGKLERQVFTKHPISASIQYVEKLLGILDILFAEGERVLPILSND
jgi:hypothetical protein